MAILKQPNLNLTFSKFETVPQMDLLSNLELLTFKIFIQFSIREKFALFSSHFCFCFFYYTIRWILNNTCSLNINEKT